MNFRDALNHALHRNKITCPFWDKEYFYKDENGMLKYFNGTEFEQVDAFSIYMWIICVDWEIKE